MLLHERLRRKREEKALSQSEVAKSIGVSRCTYTNYELGKNKPSIDTLIKLARLYEITLDELVGYSPIDTADNVSEQSGYFVDLSVKDSIMLNYFRNATERRRNEALEVLRAEDESASD